MPASKRLSRLLAAGLCLFVLAGCTAAVRSSARVPDGWQLYHQRQAGIEQWRLTARMAIQTASQGGSLDLYWTQRDDGFDIRMIAALGQGAMLLQGDTDWVNARFADGQQLSGEPAELIRQHFGVRLPVRALSFWLRGIALDADYGDASWDDQGQLHRLRQQGWRVEMSEYTRSGEYILPTRFYLEQEADDSTNLRFIVRQWQIGPA